MNELKEAAKGFAPIIGALNMAVEACGDEPSLYEVAKLLESASDNIAKAANKMIEIAERDAVNGVTELLQE